MTAFAQPCDDTPQFLKKVLDAPFYRRCSCGPCWLACLYVIVTGGSCPDIGTVASAIGWQMITIRSTTAPGSLIEIPITPLYFVEPCDGTSARADEAVDVRVGTDTKGKWRHLAAISIAESNVIHVFMASYQPSDDPDWFSVTPVCDVPEYAVPIFVEYTTFPTDPRINRNAGPIKWRDVVPLAEAAVGAMPDVGYGTGLYIGRGFGLDENYAYKDPPTTLVPFLPTSGGNALNAYTQDSRKYRAFNKAVYATPGPTITADDLVDINVQFVNPFTGNNIDGTHALSDAQETDVESLPAVELVSLLDPAESLHVASFTNPAFGQWTINDLQFRVKAGTHRIRIWGDHEPSSFIPITHYKIESGDIIVTAGAPAYVDLKPIDPSFAPVPLQMRATILDAGAALLAHVMDYLGHFNLWNVCPSATNNVTISLIDGGGNAIASPVLNGTTTQAAVAGVASFGDLDASALGRNYKLRVSSTGLSQSHNANWFEFDLELWIGLAFEAIPTINAGVPCSIKVDLKDALGNTVSPSTVDDLTLSGAGSFTGFGTVTPVAGVATFTGTFPAAGTYAIQVVTSGATYDGPPTTTAITVTVLP